MARVKTAANTKAAKTVKKVAKKTAPKAAAKKTAAKKTTTTKKAATAKKATKTAAKKTPKTAAKATTAKNATTPAKKGPGRPPKAANVVKKAPAKRGPKPKTKAVTASKAVVSDVASKENYGPRIKELRVACKLTQGQVAEALGVTPGYISNVENNRTAMSLRILIYFAKLTGQTLDSLVGSLENDYAPSAMDNKLMNQISKLNDEQKERLSKTLKIWN